jgi:hypothetical protein
MLPQNADTAAFSASGPAPPAGQEATIACKIPCRQGTAFLQRQRIVSQPLPIAAGILAVASGQDGALGQSAS